MKLWIPLCSWICFGGVGVATAGEAVTYILAPGSTITVYSNGIAIGPEPITGNFDWVLCQGADGLDCFDTARLDFQSASFSIHLHNPNNLVSGVFLFASAPTFDEVVDAPAVLTGPAELVSVYNEGSSTDYPEGTYSDPLPHPLILEYPDLRIRPLGAAGPYFAALDIKAVADRDRDGVPDDIDQCPATLAGAVVDEDGCSIEQLVPCAGPAPGKAWKNHGQYVATVSRTARYFFETGRITRKERAAIVHAAEKSDCGKKR